MSNPNAERSRRWFEEVWNQKRSEVIEEFLTPQSVGHQESGDVPGIDAFKKAHAEFLTAFPDLKVEIEAIVADGENVAVRWRASASHAGDGLGVKATNRSVSFRGMTWHRYQDGKLVEGWDSWNRTDLVQRLREAGTGPAPSGGATG